MTDSGSDTTTVEPESESSEPRVPFGTRMRREGTELKKDVQYLFEKVKNTEQLPLFLFGFVLAWWVVQFWILGAMRQDRFSTFDFDLGIFDQAAWLVAFAKFPFFMTVRGLEVFGHHANFIFVLFAPGYWLGGGPKFLLAMQVLSEAAGAIGIYLLTKDLIKGARWLPALLGTLFILHPSTQWLVWEYFHPDAFAIGPLILAYWASRRKNWTLFYIMAALAVLCKEDVALSVVILGLLIWARGNKKQGIITAVASAVWYVGVTKFLIPWRNHGGDPFYEQFFGYLGGSPQQIGWHLVTNPRQTFNLITQQERRSYYWGLLAPLAFVPLLALDVMLMAVPMIMVSVFASYVWIRDPHFHYVAVPLAVSFIAAVEALSRMKMPTTRSFAMGLMVAATAVTTVNWGIAPFSHDYKSAWPLQQNAQNIAKQRIIDQLPKSASTSAPYNIVPHIAHREKIYTFPNPWYASNWGNNDERQHDPNKVNWIIVDRSMLTGDDQAKLRTLSDCLTKKEFKIVREIDLVYIARRVYTPPQRSECAGPVSKNQ